MNIARQPKYAVYINKSTVRVAPSFSWLHLTHLLSFSSITNLCNILYCFFISWLLFKLSCVLMLVSTWSISAFLCLFLCYVGKSMGPPCISWQNLWKNALQRQGDGVHRAHRGARWAGPGLAGTPGRVGTTERGGGAGGCGECWTDLSLPSGKLMG